MPNKNKLIKDVYYNMNKGKCESPEFIRAVRNHPALYDPENCDYKMATVKEAIWKELANQFGVTSDVAKKRWKSLRDTYTKKFRISEEHAAHFKYGKELQFLKFYMKAERMSKIISTIKQNVQYVKKSGSPVEAIHFEEITQDISEKDLLQQLDINIFISQVKCHACIWNQNFNSYNILEERNKAWLNIAKHFIEDFEQLDAENQNKIIKILRRKWRRLREKYLSTKKILETRPETNSDKIFTHFFNLAFIENGFKQKRDPMVEDVNEIDSGPNNMKAEYLSDSQLNENFEEENEVELMQTNQNTSALQRQLSDTNYVEEEDEDRLFLLSLVKEMKKIPKDHKLDARLNILVVLRNWQKMHYADDTILNDFPNNDNGS
ncbi:uncharacterized protein LOC129615071 [Condylostylus longicornis]|uniref:uncharacterized protein LOC129615071 n=1 Tax=Condylostylus longicornis TaxID=2530218 RepID=UPI00244D9F3C|nr:uncharacterized protein LOC129615071 [Condylostylus longicornis]